MNKKIFFVLFGIFLIANPAFAQETYNLSLKAGENFISLPLTPQDTNIANILSPIIAQVKDVWEFTSFDTNDPWKHYQPGMEGYSDLTQMNAGKGYWINVKTNVTLQITGTSVPENFLVNLKAGWNAIGWPYQYSQGITAALVALNFGTDYSQVSRLNSSTKAQENFLNQPASDNFTTFEPGSAYYIYMLQNKTIRIGLSGPVTTTPPQISGITPLNHSTFYENDTISISPTVVNDPNSGPLEYQFSIDGVIKQSWSGQSQYGWQGVSGIHNIKAEVRNIAGQDAKQVEICVFKKPIAPPS
ncbi:MAG: hypothetical protein ABSB18_04620 [Candidatus Omnitrophota bacterium]